MKLAAQLYTLREHLKTKETIWEALKKVKEIGYEAIQVSGIGEFTKEKVQIFKEASDAYNLTICVTHTNLYELKNNLDWVIEYHKLWNCPYVGVGMMPNEYQSSKKGYQDFAFEMNKIGEKLAQHNLILVYHNHNFEFVKFAGQLGMEILFDNFNEFVQFELDTYWVQKGGCNPIDWINKVKDKMDVIHFKDIGIKGWNDFMEVVGKGNLNWEGIIEACKNISVKWICVEQDDTQGRDPYLCLLESYQFLKSKGLN